MPFKVWNNFFFFLTKEAISQMKNTSNPIQYYSKLVSLKKKKKPLEYIYISFPKVKYNYIKNKFKIV